ncbi:hypothetical protein F5Y14DRAFT_20057 [Nemania sp. NC0429]|nr:hypothetical protein F5Y14DRAFT_20057 [Nemania sp. NC0429]
MAPSPATLSSAYREAYSLDRALGRLFGGILTHLQRKQWFSDSATSPSLFVVYAHDKKEEAAANPNVAVAIINWLRKIQARAYSDLYPLSNTLCEERENGTESVANILSNQFCILPGTSKYGVVNSVDKVIVCGSELLKKYVEDKFSGPYIETIRETYERARYQDPNERQNEIRTVVESHCRKEAFHHVLTELAFIKLRYFHDSNGKSIIPVVLSGNPVPSTGCGMEYLPFLDGTDLRLKLQPAAPLADQHKLFFKLLMQISPDLTPFIQLIQDGYEDAHKELSQTTTLTERNVSEVLTSFFEKFADSMSSLIPPPMKYLERWRLTPSYGAEEIALGSTNASFLEDWQFQNRESTLKELSQLVAEKKSSGTLTILLSGPLGIGKKATVAHFLSTLLSRSRTFFVDSEDERALQTRYGEIAETLFLAPTRESGMQPYTSGQSKSVTIRNF